MGPNETLPPKPGDQPPTRGAGADPGSRPLRAGGFSERPPALAWCCPCPSPRLFPVIPGTPPQPAASWLPVCEGDQALAPQTSQPGPGPCPGASPASWRSLLELSSWSLCQTSARGLAPKHRWARKEGPGPQGRGLPPRRPCLLISCALCVSPGTDCPQINQLSPKM